MVRSPDYDVLRTTDYQANIPESRQILLYSRITHIGIRHYIPALPYTVLTCMPEKSWMGVRNLIDMFGKDREVKFDLRRQST